MGFVGGVEQGAQSAFFSKIDVLFFPAMACDNELTLYFQSSPSTSTARLHQDSSIGRLAPSVKRKCMGSLKFLAMGSCRRGLGFELASGSDKLRDSDHERCFLHDLRGRDAVVPLSFGDRMAARSGLFGKLLNRPRPSEQVQTSLEHPVLGCMSLGDP